MLALSCAAAASGRWLLFMDRSVRAGGPHWPLLREGHPVGRDNDGFPRQETGTWMEKLVVSMMMFTILCHLPLRLISRSRDPKFAAANGAFILVEQGSYLAIGGHAAVRKSLLDDMELIRLAKGCGQPVQLTGSIVWCRCGCIGMRARYGAVTAKICSLGLGRICRL